VAVNRTYLSKLDNGASCQDPEVIARLATVLAIAGQADERPSCEAFLQAIGVIDLLNASPLLVRGSRISNRRWASDG
jgi:hypothetical protein